MSGFPNPWLPAALRRPGALPWIAANAALAAAYFVLAAIVSRFFAAYGLFPAPIWLPASVAMVGAMAGGLGLAPGLFAGAFLANYLLFMPPLGQATAIALSNTAGPLVAALLLRRHRAEGGLFDSFKGITAFLLYTTLLNPAITAFGGAVALTADKPFDPALFATIWTGWWLSDSGGTLFLSAAALLWLRLEREPAAKPGTNGDDRAGRIVWAAVAIAAIAIFQVQVSPGSALTWAFPFLLTVPAAWVTLRMSLRAAQALVSLVAIVACAGTVAGLGPFQTQAGNGLQLVGVLVVTLAMTVLTIAALAAERRRAETASRVKAMFLATASHELRTPLNAIIGFSSLLAEPAGLPPEKTREIAHNIERGGQHLLALIDDLLDMSKIEAGRFDLRDERVALDAAVGEALAATGDLARRKGVTAAAGGPSGIAVNGDRRALAQILLNLLSNAIKFTPAGGRIDVAVARAPGGGAEIRVRDTGIGVPAASLERIFEPFERVRTGDARHVPGTGLGLAISRGLAELHGGTLRLESEQGEGACAILALPANRVLPPAST